MEERLNVAQSSRFPLYKQLMWHAAAFYTDCLEVELPEGANTHRSAECWALDSPKGSSS